MFLLHHEERVWLLTWRRFILEHLAVHLGVHYLRRRCLASFNLEKLLMFYSLVVRLLKQIVISLEKVVQLGVSVVLVGWLILQRLTEVTLQMVPLICGVAQTRWGVNWSRRRGHSTILSYLLMMVEHLEDQRNLLDSVVKIGLGLYHNLKSYNPLLEKWELNQIWVNKWDLHLGLQWE